jgi:PIN domain nuclease of toxin-antitoxin system
VILLISEATIGSGGEVLPLACLPARSAATLPQHHKDPAERIIIATATIAVSARFRGPAHRGITANWQGPR